MRFRDVFYMSFWILISVIAVVGFVQNMAFTWVSRSRNSGDPGHHRKAAYCSNSIWFVCQVFILSTVWPAVTSGEFWKVAITLVVYTASTAEGSVLQMKRMLRKETGTRRVGARADP
jgi:hypothetical protein